MKLALISFTEKGQALAIALEEALQQRHSCDRFAFERAPGEGAQPFHSGKALVAHLFPSYEGLVFVCACGIAVRLIAPWIASKTADPAVLVADDSGRFVISLLSGHIGRANGLAKEAAAALGAVPVITTATDSSGIFSPDSFAVANGLCISDLDAAKALAVRLLQGERIGFCSPYPCAGLSEETFYMVPYQTEEGQGPEAREGADGSDAAVKGEGRQGPEAREGADGSDAAVKGEGRQRPEVWEGTFGDGQNRETLCTAGICVSAVETDHPFSITLHLKPKPLVVGMGCKKGTDPAQLEAFFLEQLHRHHFTWQQVAWICSIDLKQQEEALVQLAAKYRIPFRTFSAAQLAAVPGVFASSAFVSNTTGVDNVCERSAMTDGGHLVVPKQKRDGMTFAAAMREIRLIV